MTCVNCSGCLQETERGWLCAWCSRSGVYAQGPALRNGRQWRVCITEQPGKAEHRNPWVPAESMAYAERSSEAQR